MIPVAPISLFLLVIITLGPLAWGIVLVWGVLLVVQPRRRVNFKSNPWPRILCLIALIALAAYYGFFQWTVYQYKKEQERELASRQHVLKETGRFAGLLMPAGTQLELAVWGDPDSVAWARFPEAVGVAKAPVLSFERPRPDLADSHWHMQLARDVELEGWLCDSSQVVEMQQDPLAEDGFRLASCALAEGNRITAWSPYAAASNLSSAPDLVLALPKGTRVQARPEGTRYTNGERDQDRWLLRVEAEGFQLSAWSLPLERAYLAVDEHQKLLYLSHAQLAQETQWGGFTYPVGTQFSSPNYRLFPQWPLLLKAVVPAQGDSVPTHERIHALPSGEILDEFH